MQNILQTIMRKFYLSLQLFFGGITQQTIFMASRIRSQSVATRTALKNQIHGHLQDFGVLVSKGRHKLERDLADIFSDETLPPLLCELLHDLLAALLREGE